jgi:2,5-furandicarboxylate decarboxylase 1
MTDLRHYLAACRYKTEIDQVVNCAHEIPAILEALESRDNFDAVLFRRVLNNNGVLGAYSVLVNLFARRDSIATMLSAAALDDLAAFNQRVAADGSLTIVSAAPVKESINEGNAIDLNSIPIVTHHERDAGPYLTSGVVVVKDPETGVYNAAIQRLVVHDKTTLGIFMAPSGHNKVVYEKYAATGRDMPLAVVVGHHPLFYLGVQTKESIDRDEYRIAASLMGGTLRLTECVSLPDLLVPADAELVLEGVMPAHDRRLEGPFAEYQHYYCSPQEREYINVTAILHRRQPIFLDIFACHRDHHLLEGTLMMAQLTQIMQAQYPEFIRLSLPLSGCCQLFCYVSMKRSVWLDLKQVGLQILQAQEYIKYVVFVDEDINVDNEAEVLWAIATRARLSDDLLLTSETAGTLMDPSARGRKRPERGVLDATAKDPAMLAKRVRVKPDVLHESVLDKYLETLA